MELLRLSAAAIAIGAALATAAPAAAIPVFAHQYDLTCQKCHSVIPRLNAFGQAFLDRGETLPGVKPDRSVLPFATKVNLVYASDPGSGTPKAVVDEIEAFVAGPLGSRTAFYVEQYLIDGGVPGSTRDAWVAQRVSSDRTAVPVFLQAGSFTLPLPVDPETFRETNQHYSIFDQTVGANPFAFFTPKIGAQLRAGIAARGTSGTFAAVQGHDQQSGRAAEGVDLMQYVQHAMGPLTLSAYQYSGRRPVGPASDRFRRQGLGVVYASRRWESDTVWQTGSDANADGSFAAARSSGAFTQLRYAIGPRLFALGRYEGTSDSIAGVSRDFVALMGYRPARNSRLTIEDVVQHVPRTKNSLAVQLTVAY